MSLAQRLEEVRTGFERPFWVANISELFERLSYYAAFASLARYLHETLSFPLERAADLSGLFGGLVWFLAIFGGAIADRLGFRRALSLAYLILAGSYFLLGSLGAPWLAPVRSAVPLVVLVTIVLMLPALGVALVKPSVVGTTARASNENVRSLGYSIYYTLVNIGGALGPFVASWVHKNLSVENVFRVASLSVFVMFFAVLLFYREPRKSGDARTESLGVTVRNFGQVVKNPKFMIFLLIFSGYWIVYWQEFITLPIYVHDYVDGKADTERMLSTGPSGGDCVHGAVQRADAENRGISRGAAGDADCDGGVRDSGGAPEHRGGICHLGGDRGWRADSAAALLRLHFAVGPAGAAGHVHGICVFAAGHWGVCFGTHRRGAAASFRRSAAPAGTVFVGVDGDWIGDDGAAVDLRSRGEAGERRKEPRVGTVRGPLHEQLKNQEEREEIGWCSIVRAHPSQNTRRMGHPQVHS